MGKDRINIGLIYLAIIAMAFVYVDSLFIPQKIQKEKLVYSTIKAARIKSSGVYEYYLKTEFRNIHVSKDVFELFADYDSLDIGRSSVSNVPKTVGRTIDNKYFKAHVSFINDGLGKILIPVFLFLTIGFRLFYRRIEKPFIRERLAILSLVLSITMLISYFF